jgi:large subunit ribosomal protein L31
MKKEIHAENHRPVIFHDNSSGQDFLIDSTIATEETGTFEGKEYPLVNVEITSASHPFYTGQEKVLDTTGRVERFKERMAKAQSDVKNKKDRKAEKKQKDDSVKEEA